MLGRIGAGPVSPPEVLLSVTVLATPIGAALWVAARVYAAGILLYGQRPGLRSLWRLARAGMRSARSRADRSNGPCEGVIRHSRSPASGA
jgi:hypothetical protein